MKMLPGIRKDLVEHPGNTLGFVRLLFDLGNYLDASISILPFAKTHLTDPSYLVLAAKIHLANGLIEEAAGQLLDAMEISQAMPEAHYLLGLALLWLGDVGHAEQSLKNAIQFMADYEQAHRLLSAVFYQQGLNELSQHHHQVAGSLKKSVYNEIENNHPHHLLHYLRQKGLMHLK